MPALTRPRPRPDAGFALVELLAVVALLLPLSLVATTLAVHALRGLGQAILTAGQETAMADAALVLESELAPLAAGDGLLAMAPTRLWFRAARAAGRWCQRDSAHVVMPPGPSHWAASRLPVAGRDSLVFEVADTLAPTGYRRLRLGIIAPPVSMPCPGGTIGLQLSFSPGLAPWTSSELVQTEEVMELAAYVSAGETWLGLRHLGLGTVIEPVAGPFAAGGIQFEGLDALGAVTLIPGAVHTVRVNLTPAGKWPPARTLAIALRG